MLHGIRGQERALPLRYLVTYMEHAKGPLRELIHELCRMVRSKQPSRVSCWRIWNELWSHTTWSLHNQVSTGLLIHRIWTGSIWAPRESSCRVGLPYPWYRKRDYGTQIRILAAHFNFICNGTFGGSLDSQGKPLGQLSLHTRHNPRRCPLDSGIGRFYDEETRYKFLSLLEVWLSSVRTTDACSALTLLSR